jgi:hypothetical protein
MEIGIPKMEQDNLVIEWHPIVQHIKISMPTSKKTNLFFCVFEAIIKWCCEDLFSSYMKKHRLDKNIANFL